MNAFKIVGCCVVGATLSGRGAVHYVAPDGTGDGTSWAAAASFETAYAAAGEDGGGELWLKKGFHLLTNTVILKSDVIVRGGFSGAESSASEADPKANVTSISGDTDHDNKWCPNGSFTKNQFFSIYDGNGGYIPVNPNRTNSHWSPGDSNATYTDYAVNDLPVGFSNATDVVVTGAEFRGVTFSGFKNAAFLVTQGSVTGFVLDGCDFIANNTVYSTYAAAYLSTVSGEMTDCGFYGNRRALYLGGGSNVLTRCTFKENPITDSDTQYHSAPVSIDGSSTKAYLTDCVFTRNYNGNIRSYPNANSFFQGGGSSVFNRCTFTENLAHEHGSGSRGNCRGVIQMFGGSMSVKESMFTKNVTDQAGQTSALLFTHTAGSLTIDSCYFADNVITNRSASYAMAILLLTDAGANAKVAIANSTIERNRAVAMAAGGIGTVVSRARYTSHGFANSLLADNVLETAPASTATEVAEYVSQLASAGTTHAVFFNTVMTGRGTDGHKAFSTRDGANARLCFINSVFYGYPDQALSNIDQSCINNTETNAQGYVCISKTDPKVMSFARTGPNGLKSRGLSPSSPYVKKGRNVWRGTDGAWVYYNTAEGASYEPYHYANHSGSLKVSDATAIGVSTGNPCAPDAFGVVRKLDKVTPGPLVPHSGLALLFR